MSNIVSAKWLKENLHNENLIIIDCRFSLMDKNYGKNSYEKSHIEGAVRVDIETELSAPVTIHGGRHPLPSVEELKSTFERIGVSNDSIVVAYDEGDLSGPSRLWWILKYLGHENVYVLDGGINEFIATGGKVTDEETVVKRGNFDLDINEDLRVDMEYVKTKHRNEDVALVDCREYKRYLGEFEPVDKKAGHIPNAKSYFWMNILNKEDDKLNIKNTEDLNEYFKNLRNFDEVILYCGSGITASPVSLALDEINIPHKLYGGSFSDWISYDENEVATI